MIKQVFSFVVVWVNNWVWSGIENRKKESKIYRFIDFEKIDKIDKRWIDLFSRRLIVVFLVVVVNGTEKEERDRVRSGHVLSASSRFVQLWCRGCVSQERAHVCRVGPTFLPLQWRKYFIYFLSLSLFSFYKSLSYIEAFYIVLNDW